jgi:hypothetical protein
LRQEVESMGLSDQPGRSVDTLFYEAPRVCERCDERTSCPDRVTMGADAVEYHLCPDGEYGVLRLVYPPPGREVRDPTKVDFDPSKEDPR